MQLLRADLDIIEELRKDWTDIKVIYQLRHPRGILSSRQESDKLVFPNVTQEAVYLCQKMMRDYYMYTMLKRKYPRMMFKTTYESIMAQPAENANTIYNFLDIPMPWYIKDWAERLSEAKPIVRSQQSENSTTSKRQVKLRPKTKAFIDTACKGIYFGIGYK